MLTVEAVEKIAPDQASLKAAAKLMKPAKWPVLEFDPSSGLIWGECQGSGANPYKVVVDTSDIGYKCTCPSRKFPCKHALALMWFRAEGSVQFTENAVPQWVTDWLGRRRKTGGNPTFSTEEAPKNIGSAKAVDPEKPTDPKVLARNKAAAEKRAKQTRASMIDATRDLDQWIADQLRTGLSSLSANLTEQCRKIAARLVDGKAQTLAGRVDELPSRVLAQAEPLRTEVLMVELSKLVLLARAFRSDPDSTSLKNMIGGTINRDTLLGDPATLKVRSRWEVIGEQVTTRRDGLVSQMTWLLNLNPEGPVFALLLDFFPASAGKRGGVAAPGEQFEAELAFYPSPIPQRAIIVERKPGEPTSIVWPEPSGSGLDDWQKRLSAEPWTLAAPLSLPAGRIVEDENARHWWQASEDAPVLPLIDRCKSLVLGMPLSGLVGIWDGWALTPLAAHTSFGRLHFDG